ncbi:hypothetical protein GGX14DRAFT_560920 [Mycena pura]|uniref:Uncharacterized protein n=1 Tax=Mycena pura TaxID=153505 RepID=A0AAD6VNZ2_9AGAR|nr:hypothetical protein GGX14DRAFT_560920 [Mycena pura]
MKVEDKLDTYGETSNLIPLKDFIIFFLTPFVAILLIAEDKNLNIEDAADVRDASNEFGQLMQADDDSDEEIQNLHQGNSRDKRVSLASSHLRLTTHQVLHAHLHMASQTTRTPSAPALCQSLRDEARTLVATTHSIANSRRAQSRPNSRSIAFPARALHRTVVFILHDRMHSHTRTTALKHVRSLRLTSWPLDLVVVAVFTIRFPLYQVHFLCCHFSPLAVWHRATAWELFAGCVLVLTLSVFTPIDYHVLVHRVSRSSSHANVKKGGPIVLSIEENFHGRTHDRRHQVRFDWIPGAYIALAPHLPSRPEPHVRPCPPRAVGRFHHWPRRARPRPWSRGRMVVPSDGALSSNQKRGGAFEIRPQFWDDVAGWPASRAGWDGRTVYVPRPRTMLTSPGKLKPFALVTFARAADAEALRAEAQAREPADAARIGFRACSKARWDVLNAEYLVYRARILADMTQERSVLIASGTVWRRSIPSTPCWAFGFPRGVVQRRRRGLFVHSGHVVCEQSGGAGRAEPRGQRVPDDDAGICLHPRPPLLFLTSPSAQLRAPFGITVSTIVFNALEHNAGCRGLDALKSRAGMYLQLCTRTPGTAGRESDVPPAALRNVSPLHTRRPPTDINAALKDIVFENVLGEHLQNHRIPAHRRFIDEWQGGCGRHRSAFVGDGTCLAATTRTPTGSMQQHLLARPPALHLPGLRRATDTTTPTATPILLHACSSPSSRYAGILTTDPNAVPELLPALYLTPACTAFGVLHNSSPSPVRELTQSGAHHEVNKHARLDLFRTKIKSGIWVGYRMGWFWE